MDATTTTRSRGVDVSIFIVALFGALAFTWGFALAQLGEPASPVHIPWPVFAAGFVLGHFAGIRISFRNSTHRFDLTDVVFLPAAAFSAPRDVILAAALGTIVRSAYLKRPIQKATFNVVVHALAVALGLIALQRVLAGAPLISLRGWLAGLVAVLVTQVVAVFAIQIVISLASGRWLVKNLREVPVTLLYTVGIQTVCGLVGVEMLWLGIGGGVLYAIAAISVAIGFVIHGRLRTRHLTLRQLYRFERALIGITESGDVITAILKEALTLFNAETAQLIRVGASATTTFALHGSDALHTVDKDSRIPRELFGEGAAAIVVPRGDHSALAAALSAIGLRDAVAVRLPIETEGHVNVLLVANRLGPNQATFTVSDGRLAEAMATPTAMALRSSALMNELRAEVIAKQHEATHDALTGLANRGSFNYEVDRVLREQRRDALVGLLVLDLDGFKRLNDTMGHDAGDSYLRRLSARLRNVVGERGTVARLGGDEFAIVLERAASIDEIRSVAAQLEQAVGATRAAADLNLAICASIGIAAAPLHGSGRKVLMRHADFAMYRAKEVGGGVAVHGDESSGYIDRPTLVAALHDAIDTSMLELYYQPKVVLGSEKVTGVEALLRWNHPNWGPMSPDVVIPVAEVSGLMPPLTNWVLEQAVAQCSAWHREGFTTNVAVNISPAQIDDSELVRNVQRLLHGYRLAPDALTLEITESAGLTAEVGRSVEVLDELTRLGVRLSIDDFGVGTSSLYRMRRFPVSEIKIDKSFITNLDADARDRAVVSSTIQLAHDLGLEVVAEGVESLCVYRRLRAAGCDTVQGYLFSPPLEAASLKAWVESRMPAPFAAPPPQPQLELTSAVGRRSTPRDRCWSRPA